MDELDSPLFLLINVGSDRHLQEEGMGKRKCELRALRLHVEGVLECGRGEGETEEVGNLVGNLVSSHKVEFHDSHQKGDLGLNAQRDQNGPRVFAGV